MNQLQNFGDSRQVAFCAYCGGQTQDRDHVPSKVFLDSPFPANLPVVPACRQCNAGVSLDEEYVACLIECAATGSVFNSMQRPKIRHILRSKPALRARLEQARRDNAVGSSVIPEAGRVSNVVLKLARGHALFELNEPQLSDPTSASVSPLGVMTTAELRAFESPPVAGVWPEVGSRALQRMVIDNPGVASWISPQPGRYRYLASVTNGVTIRMVIREYLACEVNWNP
jgi:hypothetical protein